MPIKIKENNVWIPVTDDAVWGKIEGEITDQADLKKELDKKATVTALNSGLKDKQDKGDYATNTALTNGLKGKQDAGNYQPAGDYATKEELTNELAKKQDNGDYATNIALTQGLSKKQNVGNYALKSDLTPLATKEELTNGLSGKQPNGDYATTDELTNGLKKKQDVGDYALKSDLSPYAKIQDVNNELAGKASNTALSNEVKKLNTAITKLFPVGSLYFSTLAANPSTYIGFGTWEAFAEGRTLIGNGGGYEAGATGGEASHVLSVDEIPSHSHGARVDEAGRHRHTIGTDGVQSPGENSDVIASNRGQNPYNPNVNTSWEGTHSHRVTIGETGGGQAHNNLPPYIVTYIWKRTA